MIQSLLIQALLTALFKYLTADKAKGFVADILKWAKGRIHAYPVIEAIVAPELMYLAQVLEMPDAKFAVEFSKGGRGLQMVFSLINGMFDQLGTDAGKHAADAFLDKIEVWVLKTKTKIDDKVVLPLVAFTRSTFDIPDFEDAPVAANPQ